MPRSARKRAGSGIYHIMLRGTDRRVIFTDDEDCARFTETLQRVREVSGFRLYAYCLMGNHVHLLMQEGKEPLEAVFKRIGSSYVYYYNRKYELEGHLFQDRFRSEPVENDAYFMDVVRYICQNPVKAGLCDSPLDYPWLKCSGVQQVPELDSISEYTDLDGVELLRFISEPCSTDHLEMGARKGLTDRQAMEKICAAAGCSSVQEIGGWEAERRTEAVIRAAESGASIRQISRLTGISKALVEKALKR